MRKRFVEDAIGDILGDTIKINYGDILTRGFVLYVYSRNRARQGAITYNLEKDLVTIKWFTKDLRKTEWRVLPEHTDPRWKAVYMTAKRGVLENPGMIPCPDHPTGYALRLVTEYGANHLGEPVISETEEG